MNTEFPNCCRITARVPVSVRQTLETAASMTGATVNQFIVQAALREAERVIEHEYVIRLSAQDGVAFLRALDNPQPPNERLTTALRDNKAGLDDQVVIHKWTPRPMRD